MATTAQPRNVAARGPARRAFAVAWLGVCLSAAAEQMPLQTPPPDLDARSPLPGTLLPQPESAPPGGYTLERESGAVRFGDGVRGKRLPAPRGTTPPSYRTGGGAAGDAPANGAPIVVTTPALAMTGRGGTPSRARDAVEPLQLTTPAIAMTGFGGTASTPLSPAEPVVVHTPALTMRGYGSAESQGAQR